MRYRSVVICKDGRRPSRLDSAKQATINRFRWLDQIHGKSDHAKTPNTPHLFFSRPLDHAYQCLRLINDQKQSSRRHQIHAAHY